MKKFVNLVLILTSLSGCFWFGSVLADKQTLREEILRLHVVAASDTEEDQAVKLQVRDAILEAISADMDASLSAEEAKKTLSGQLENLEQVANQTLSDLGCSDTAVVTLQEEAFPVRVYDTFTLPSGVYDSLRVTIGEGEGHNWWCVVFPTLCVPATSQGMEDVAAGAGFSEELSGALTGEYEIRFFLLDCLGKVENFLEDF